MAMKGNFTLSRGPEQMLHYLLQFVYDPEHPFFVGVLALQ